MGWLSDRWSDVGDLWDSTNAGDTFQDMGQQFVDLTGLPQLWKNIKHALIPDMRRDRETMLNSATSARRIIYGRTRVGSSLVYAETSGDKDEHLNLIVVFATHEIDRYDEIWFNDQLAATVSAGVVTVVAPFAGFAIMNLHDGTQTTADSGMLTATHGNWTADHKLLGCAYAYIRLTYSESVYVAGVPQVKAVIRGKRVYDPRSPAAPPYFFPNPALCIRDYMMLPQEQGGMGCESGEIDDAAVITAANICDQAVNLAGGENRYTLNGVISLDNTPITILKSMLAAMAGTALYSGSEWEIYAGAASAAVATIDESWLNGAISFTTGNNKSELINTAKGTFTNPDDSWADTEFPAVINDAYVTDDGEELTADLSLPFTTSSTMAQRLAGIEMQKSRYGMALTYPCIMRAACLNAMDVVAINNTLLGWSGKLFRIMSWDFAAMGGVNLSLVEDSPNIWADPSTYGSLTPPVMTNLPDPWTVAAPDAVTVNSTQYTGIMPNDTKANIVLTWTQPQAGTTFDIIQDGVIIQNVNDTTYTIPDLPPGSHDVGVRSRNGIGTVSGWVMSNVVIPAFTDPSETLRFLNTDIDEDKLAQYLLQNISISQLLDTYDQSVVPGVFTSGATGTLPDIILGTAKQIVLMAGEVGKQTSQIELLNDRISFKLNSNGHVAGMAIGWDESGDVSETVFINDVFKICLPDGTGIKQAFTVGTVGGVSTIGVNGNMIIDGTLNASALVADTAMVNFLNALEITAGSIDADKITSGTELKIDSTYDTVLATLSIFVDSTTKGCLNLIGNDRNSAIPALSVRQGQKLGSPLSSAPAASFRSDGDCAAVFIGGLGAIRCYPSTSASSPDTVISSQTGALWVTSAGVLYICTGGSAWAKVGAQ